VPARSKPRACDRLDPGNHRLVQTAAGPDRAPDHDGAELVGAQRLRASCGEHRERGIRRMPVAVVGADRDEPDRRAELLVQLGALVTRTVVRHLDDVGSRMRVLAKEVALRLLPQVAEGRQGQADGHARRRRLEHRHEAAIVATPA
jgi:hypothetical protein